MQFEYAYDASSNETHRYAYLPNSVTIDQVYGRDSLNRMSSRLVKKNGTTFSTEAYTYDHMNRITEVNRGGPADSFVFYWDGELQSASYGGGPHAPYSEGQDPDLDTTDNIDPNAGYQPPGTEEPEPTPPPDDYSDPKVGGLIPLDLPGGRSLGYYFDRAGNRQQVTDTSNPTTNYVVTNMNQYSSVSGSTISNGNEHEVSSFQGLYDTHPVNYYYVNDEHLKQASDGTYNRYFFYDALGRCVKRSPTITDTTSTTYYIYDGEKPILEYNSTGGLIARNIYGKGVDEILMRTDGSANGGNPIHYAQDHEGSVTHLINGCTTPSSQTGNVLEKYAYDAFGVPTFMDSGGNNLNPNATVCNNRFLFTGREYAATYRGTYVSTFSFYEYRARAYNPNLGRFMSEDPKLFVRRAGLGAPPADWTFAAHPDEAEFNLFRYCGNDPIDFEDPMGLDATQAAAVIGGALVLVGEEEGFGLGTPPAHVAAALTFGGALIYAGVKYFDHPSSAHAPPAKMDSGKVDARSKQPPPVTDKPHTIIERPGAKGQYTTYHGDGTSKQYRGSGKGHDGIPRPNVKETTTHTGPNGKQSTTEIVRPAKPEEIPPDLPPAQRK
ncbi:MAG TPA: RHS repeat-associated core domain-containing protein [Candidatus Udaeobacter sp.]|nr:RHS repeat-associated core domain-containing protein [Candidatus Udaeobacter sp.]